MKPKITFVCGATLGHIFPALNIASKISFGTQLQFIVSKNSKFLFFFHSFDKVFISAKPLYFRKDFLIRLFLFLKSFFEAYFILIKPRPDLLISFGSYVSFPVVLIAKILNIPIIIHEQNLKVGIANKILFYICDYFAISFKETKELLPAVNKVIYSGMLTRPDLKKYSREEAARFFNFDPSRFTVLVMGGSQGSHRINNIFLESLSKLNLDNLQIIHLSGQKDYDSLNRRYLNYRCKIYLLKFLENISLAYSMADLIIARSGAMTLAELAFFHKASILIPYPWASAHQIENAKLFKNNGLLCSIIDEKMLTAEKLSITISKLQLEYKDNRLEELFDFNASDNLIEKIYSLVKKQ
ncbi:MAG: UDP-N-acetylglucosamine--N-acetylmuramyl-(pentapeptide) pyrophosphoryl-undecaprenol N-acetylglucosamine transferase [Candidatus Omnitrophota bacterium]